MKSPAPQTRRDGFTLVEMLVVIAIIGILAALLLPTLGRARLRASRISCVNNLKELGVGFYAFAHDHDGKFPMQVPVSDGGGLEFVQAAYRAPDDFAFAFREFQALSNELVMTRLLICPLDDRQPAPDFASLRNENLSYFVTANPEYGKPASLLAGDRNVTNDWLGRRSVLRLDANSYARWTTELHGHRGNALFADGHVDELKGPVLGVTTDGSIAAADLLIPSVKPGPGQTASTSPGPRPIAPPAATAPGVSPGPSVPPAQPPGMSSVNQAGYQETLPKTAPSPDSPVREKAVAAVTPIRVQTVAAPVAAAPTTLTFDQRFVSVTQRAIKWGYLLLVLLLLLVMAFELWRRSRQKTRQPPAPAKRTYGRAAPIYNE